MNNKDRRQQEELEVFREFANVCPLSLLANTAQNRPEPEPDILCELQSGEKLAFELTQCTDNKEERETNAALGLKRELTAAFAAAIREGTISAPERFNFQAICLDYDRNSSKQKCTKAVPEVIRLLNERGTGSYDVDISPFSSIRCERYRPCSHVGPEFCVNTDCCFAHSTVSRIEDKLKKNYETGPKIHLLACSYTGCPKEVPFWHKQLVELLKSNGMGPFDRIWVFGVTEKSILFDSAKSGA